jgi:hypothetical protein
MDGAADMAPAKNRTPKLTTRRAAFALSFINDGYTIELEVVKTLNLETASLGKLRRPSSLRDRPGRLNSSGTSGLARLYARQRSLV